MFLTRSVVSCGVFALLTACASVAPFEEPPPGDSPRADCRGLGCLVPVCKAQGSVPVETILRGRVTTQNGLSPVADAVVYVPESGTLAPLPAALSCDLCTSPSAGRNVTIARTDAQGQFVLRGVPAADKVPLVVQKGRFRRLFQVPVAPCQDQTLPLSSTLSLPASRSEGDLPRMAVATGDHDSIECVLSHLGIALSEFGPPSPERAVHLYNNHSPGQPTLPGQAPVAELLRDLDRLRQYDVVFLGCSATTYSSVLLREPQVLDNLREYVGAGGRLYVTDWSYDFLAQLPALSPLVCFEDDLSCAVTTPHGFHTAVAKGGTGEPLLAAVDRSTEKGRALAAWLPHVTAQPPLRPDALPITDLLPGWVQLRQVASPAVTTWLSAESSGRVRPLTISLDFPVAAPCGRVLFSSYHTRERPPGLTFPSYCPAQSQPLPQEHILGYLLYELSSCLGPIARTL